MRNIAKQLHSTCVGCIQWGGKMWSGNEIWHVVQDGWCGYMNSLIFYSRLIQLDLWYCSALQRTHCFIMFNFISYTSCLLEVFKGRLGASPGRTNRKSGSPISHIATTNVEAAEHCCQVNAKIADLGWVAWRDFVKRRGVLSESPIKTDTWGQTENEQNL